tara:strand:- start:274 stop:1206 length:933 start_codon:yes stop_codon:yes gene_type:complete
MRPIQVTVGPLATASATKIAGAQRAYAAGALALNGAASNAVSNNIATSHSPGASAFTLTNTNAANKYLTITCGSDNSTLTVAVVGVDINGTNVLETIALTNAQISASANRYMTVTSMTPSGSVTGAVVVGTFTVATLDLARQVLFTTSASESGTTATVYGTDVTGNLISETISLPASATTVASVLDYKTVYKATVSAALNDNITFGTNGIAASPWIMIDSWAMSQVAIQCTVSGTVNYTLQQTLDDPNSPTNAVARASVTWASTSDTALVGATATQQSNYAYPPTYTRVLLNSGTGTVTMTATQALSAVA